jgi:hypothetical protein
MAKISGHDSNNWEISLLWYFLQLMAGAACIFLLLYELYRPTVYANPGLAAYEPPPGTVLLPLPGKHDAPILAAMPDETLDRGASPVQAQANDKPKHAEHSRARTASRRRAPGEAPSRNEGYRDRGNAWQIASRPWF